MDRTVSVILVMVAWLSLILLFVVYDNNTQGKALEMCIELGYEDVERIYVDGSLHCRSNNVVKGIYELNIVISPKLDFKQWREDNE